VELGLDRQVTAALKVPVSKCRLHRKVAQMKNLILG
jgi:hypothetical protein